MPDFSFESRFAGRAPVCGVDEAGRGPLAGPVIAAAVILDAARLPEGLDDSKKLSARARASAFARIHELALAIGVGEASVEEIDALNIRRATHLAMARAVSALALAPRFALVDGNDAPALACPCETIVGGDGRSLSIAAASIVAKVTRDALMDELHGAHPAYGWRRNKGYGTAEHMTALKTHGATVHHRKSFAPIHNMLCGWNLGDSSASL